MEITWEKVAKRLFWGLKERYPVGEGDQFETFLKTEVGLTSDEIRGFSGISDEKLALSEERTKEIICCEMNEMQRYFSENYEDGLAKLTGYLKGEIKLDDSKIAYMRDNGYFNDWISSLDAPER